MVENKFFGPTIPFVELPGAKAEHWEHGRAVTSIEVRLDLNQ